MRYPIFCALTFMDNYPKVKYSQSKLLKNTRAIINLYGNWAIEHSQTEAAVPGPAIGYIIHEGCRSILAPLHR